MRIEPPATNSGVAGQAVALGVAGHAALQALPSGLTVAQKEEFFGIVIAGLQLSASAQTGLHVTVGAELPSVVAVAAAGFPGVRRSRVAGKEAGGVIARSGIGGIRPVAVEALGPHMAPVA
jgi:hypothetical protein